MHQTRDVSHDVNIICLYWIGEFRERCFIENDVLRLRQSVSKHIDRPYRFYCLTNNMNANIPAIKIPLRHNWPGWWSKMELHRDDLPEGRTLYLDLDSHVVNNLGPILDYEGDLVMFPNHMKKREDPTIVCKYQAATMLFSPGKMYYLYSIFCTNADKYMKEFRADQDFMGKFASDLPTFPDNWMCKLTECIRNKTIKDDVIIVTGQPKNNGFRKMPKILPWLEKRARG